MNPLFDEKLAELKALGYAPLFYPDECGEWDNDTWWVCPIGQHPEGPIGIGKTCMEAMEEALESLHTHPEEIRS